MFCYCFASHHNIITQPQFHLCCIINSNDHISSDFFQTIVHLIHFIQNIVHLIHFLYQSPSHSDLPYLVTLILHCHSILLSLPPLLYCVILYCITLFYVCNNLLLRHIINILSESNRIKVALVVNLKLVFTD